MNYIVSPSEILRRAVLVKLISDQEANDPKFVDAAEYAAEDLASHWPEDQGFGSSDMTSVYQNFLGLAGIETTFVDYKLTRV